MNPVLLVPAALASLAALAIPVLIHMARRQQQRPTMFAALRWLRARPKPRRRLRLDEPWLLALRLLLVALPALLLARPALLGVVDPRPRLLVMPGVTAASIDSVRAEQGIDARWLAPGYPSLDQPAPAGRIAAASLLREFDATLPPQASLTVLVPPRFVGADAARPQLSREVTWTVVDGEESADPDPVQPPAMAIRHDDTHRDGVVYLRAVAIAWQAGGDAAGGENDRVDVATTADLPTTQTELLAWLRDDPPPATVLQWTARGGQLLLPAGAAWPGDAAPTVLWRDPAGAPLLQAAAMGQGRLLQFARPLVPSAMPQLLDPAFATTLRDLVQPLPPPTVVAAVDYRPQAGALANPAAAVDLRPWLALAIALLFGLERWFASGRRLGAAS